MTPKERATEIMRKNLSIITGINESLIFYFHKDDYKVEMARQFSLIQVGYMILAQKACFPKMANLYEQSDQYKYLVKIKKEIDLL